VETSVQAEVQAGCWSPVKTSLDFILSPTKLDIHFSKAHKVWRLLLLFYSGA
jgi:hypothetical protein